MPAAAIILPLVETVVAPMVAPIVSSALAGTGVAALGTAAATQIATTALLGGGGSALIAAAQGQDVGKAALMGAITGGVGQAAAPIAGSVTQATLGNTAQNIILNSTTVGDVVTGALKGAIGSGAQAAATGGDILKAAEGGAVSGAASNVLSNVLGGALGAPEPKAGEYGPQQPTGLTGTLTGGTVPLVSGTLAGLATGQTPEKAVMGALPGAVGGALSGAARYALGLDPSTSQSIGGAGYQATKYATASGAGPSYPTYQAPPSPGLSMQGPAPSATLGQSLSIAPTLGYSPGLTVFGSGGEGDQPKKPVWNVASLRNVGSAEA